MEAAIEGAAEASHHAGTSDDQGRVRIEFPLPPLGKGDLALVIHARADGAKTKFASPCARAQSNLGMTVTINGERREIPDGLNVAALLEHLGMSDGRVAIERNLDILPRARWQETQVQSNDSFEIVHFVGGG